jgi:hypothetical protein
MHFFIVFFLIINSAEFSVEDFEDDLGFLENQRTDIFELVFGSMFYTKFTDVNPSFFFDYSVLG